MSEDLLQTLINLLYENKQKKSCTLVLSPGLTFIPALWQQLEDCASWSTFYERVETMSQEQYTALLRDHFKTLQLSKGYQDLARLILEGYFNVVFTTNMDTFLGDAIENAIKALPDGSKAVKRLIRGQDSDEQITNDLQHLSAEQHTVCWLRGCINNDEYYGKLTKIINFPEPLELAVKDYLSGNVLLVGFIRNADLDISRCLSKVGGDIWYVNPDQDTDLSLDRCHGRVISGHEADFNNFFRSLAEDLQGKDLINNRNLTSGFDGHSQDRRKDIMGIDDTQLRQLREALLSAFPTHQDLEVMVFDQLQERLGAITRDGNLQYTAFDLIQWAEANGRLEELVIGAIKQNSRNSQLRSVAEQFGLRNDQRTSSSVTPMSKSEPQRDFFISYNSRDRQWAEWIAWQLEDAGYTVYIQAWDFLYGKNFVLEMQRAASDSKRTVAVLSENYLSARFTQSEWAAAFAQDPTGELGIFLPVRVRECNPQGLLRAIVYIDLVGSKEVEARKLLLDGIGGVVLQRNKPGVPPPFPR